MDTKFFVMLAIELVGNGSDDPVANTLVFSNEDIENFADDIDVVLANYPRIKE